jgi:hypothetical protein
MRGRRRRRGSRQVLDLLDAHSRFVEQRLVVEDADAGVGQLGDAPQSVLPRELVDDRLRPCLGGAGAEHFVDVQEGSRFGVVDEVAGVHPEDVGRGAGCYVVAQRGPVVGPGDDVDLDRDAVVGGLEARRGVFVRYGGLIVPEPDRDHLLVVVRVAAGLASG